MKRPQHPKPPFPYHSEEVVIKNKVAAIELAGTLTIPTKTKAVAVLITGSGAQDRDETLFNHKPFWVIADYLARQGYAVLRIDDRGVGASGGVVTPDDTSADYVSDISAAVDYLRQRVDLPKEKIGLIGHSEGGMIAPMLAAERDDIAFIIMLAGPGIPIYQLLAEQNYLIEQASGFFKDNDLLTKRSLNEIFYSMLSKLPLDQEISTPIKEQLRKSLAVDGITNESQIDAILKHFDTDWFRFFIAYDPADYFGDFDLPLLALFGGTDQQVAAKSNMQGLGKLLMAYNYQDYIIKELKDHNHLFQYSTTGNVNEYGDIEETFSTDALKIISEWLDKRYQN